MRNAFADEITKLTQTDPRVVLLSGDIGNRLFDPFKEARADRFFNCGVAEQNMTGVAAGMALSGLRPFTYTIAPFATTRCLEQIRTDAAYHDVPVTVVSVGGGLAYAGLGPTHHACEDLAFLRAIPNMTVLAPGDAWEVRAALRAVLQQPGPAYIRLGKKGEATVHDKIPAGFEIGKALPVRSGGTVCLLSTGNMLPEALETAAVLSSLGVLASVISFHTIKPLDYACLADVFARYSLVAVMEEHSVIGGFGAAICEWLVDMGIKPKKFLRFGTPDQFFKQSGSQGFARGVLGLSAPHMANRILSEL